MATEHTGASGSTSSGDVTENTVELHRAIQRLNARAWGIAVALLGGVGIFIATNVLVLKGGANVGQHLGLLGQYFPGYSVTFVGSIIGFIYLFVIGYVVGRLIGLVYNRLVM